MKLVIVVSLEVPSLISVQTLISVNTVMQSVEATMEKQCMCLNVMKGPWQKHLQHNKTSISSKILHNMTVGEIWYKLALRKNQMICGT